MQTPIAIGFWFRNVVFCPVRDLFPQRLDYLTGPIACSLTQLIFRPARLQNDPQTQNIMDLFRLPAISEELLHGAIAALTATLDGDTRHHGSQEGVSFQGAQKEFPVEINESERSRCRTAIAVVVMMTSQPGVEIEIGIGEQIAEGEVLELQRQEMGSEDGMG